MENKPRYLYEKSRKKGETYRPRVYIEKMKNGTIPTVLSIGGRRYKYSPDKNH